MARQNNKEKTDLVMSKYCLMLQYSKDTREKRARGITRRSPEKARSSTEFFLRTVFVKAFSPALVPKYGGQVVRFFGNAKNERHSRRANS